MTIRRQYALALLLGLSIAVVFYAVGSMRTESAKQEPQKKELITSVPEVISCVKKIKVLHKGFKWAGGNGSGPIENAMVEVEVENSSDLSIIAISLDTRKGREAYSEIQSSFEADEPTIIIQPHSTATLAILAANLFTEVPLQIGSVTYADGTIEGCEESNKMMRAIKEKGEKRKAQKKEAPQ
jgi:hypothetical protein